ncbi:HAD family phosphatase [Thermococcus sibiricus]|uniref:Beta-phosphoglucomutase n=1 Tax=Thermococcus sibiricus TaxID=172049 RepID=A0A101ELZ4_9EURY|nr:HAD family hydrolase [Thermococcus sibiricus]KUK17802.1 MAG: Uncharacterized protein XD54_0899 [Thermococcus sibiricus]
MIALIWDFDGVLVFTPHEKAWKRAARRYGANISHDFYVNYVSGKPRYEGAHNILELTGIYEKYGADTEEKKKKLLHEFAEFKNNIVNEMFERGEYEVNWNAVKFLLEAKKAGVKNALASASKNATNLAKKVKVGEISLADLFEVNVSGKAPSKKEVFKLAIDELKNNFPDVKFFFVVEDAPAGVQAGRELGAFTLGYEKEVKLDADITFEDFSELNVEVLYKLIERGRKNEV